MPDSAETHDTTPTAPAGLADSRRPPRAAWGLRLTWFGALGAVILACERAPGPIGALFPALRRDLAFGGLLIAAAAVGMLVVWPALARSLRDQSSVRGAWAIVARELAVLAGLAAPWFILAQRWSGMPNGDALVLVAYVGTVMLAASAWAVADAVRFDGRVARPALAGATVFVAGMPMLHFAFFEFAGRGFPDWSAASPVWWLVRTLSHDGGIAEAPAAEPAFACAAIALALGLVAPWLPRRRARVARAVA